MTKTALGMYPYGICAAAAVLWFAASAVIFAGRKNGSEFRKAAFKASCVELYCALVLSRLVFCASNYVKYFIYEPSLIPALTEGGLSMWGALFGMFAGALIYSKVSHINYTALLDDMTPGMLGIVLIMRFGERFTSQSVGKEIMWRALEGTPLSCLDDWGYPVFAVYRMELFCAAALLILAVLLLCIGKTRPGTVNIVCLSLLSAFQVVFECMKDVGYLYVYYIRITQAMAVFLMLIMLLIRLVPLYGKRPAIAAALTAAFLLGCGIVVKMSFAIDTPERLEMNLAVMLMGSLLSAASVITAWFCVPSASMEDSMGEAEKNGKTYLWLSMLFIVLLLIALPYLIPSGMNI